MSNSKSRSPIYLLVLFFLLFNGFQSIASTANFTCTINFSCPSNTVVVNSISPDSTGWPVVQNPAALDSIYYMDVQLTPICASFALERTWVLRDTFGDTCSCIQQLDFYKDFDAIVLPTDTIFQGCLPGTEFMDFNITGFPTFYDLPLSNVQYMLGLIIIKEDSIASPTKIKRKFWVADSCLPSQPPYFLGSQYIETDFPNFNLLELTISDPLQTMVLSEICNNDPIHFCQQYNGMTPSANGVKSITWQHNDGSGWVDETDPAFGDFCFVVPPTKVQFDCSSSTTGFVTRAYRAQIEIIDTPSEDTCLYYSDIDTLKICCPVSLAYLQIDDGTPMCEGQMRTVQVDLKGAPFLETFDPTSFVTISWTIDGVAMPSLDNMPTIGTTFTAGTSDYCIKATVTNCGGKQAMVEVCIPVDPQPICGTITALSIPTPLIPDGTNSNLFYICPGDDGVIGIDQPFLNCIPQWEYSFDLNAWQSLGYSNSVQNTNVLPSYLWPSPTTTAIYYRIACQPLSPNSACDPCYGDTLEIRLLDAPLQVNITGNSPICADSTTNLIITPQSNPVLPITYTWLHNGLVVGTGNTFAASEDGCYWVEASDGCQEATSAQFCLDVCETLAIISCPLMPNECAYQGQPITLTGCGSQSSCSTANFTYQWAYDNGTLVSINGCTIEHLPDPAGTTYTLTVTDVVNGCTAMTTRFVKPCSN